MVSVDEKGVTGDGFFRDLAAMPRASDTFDAARYRPAPGDWCLIATDIENSTGAIAAGRHKTVNFVAACAIAALKNLCAPLPIPFLFGGDGSIVLVPGAFERQARLALARLRGLAQREFDVALRVGLVRIDDVRRFGAEVLVARYEPSPGNNFGVFLGGGVDLVEAALKRRGIDALSDLLHIPLDLDDRGTVDLTGLSCRWEELRSKRGKMLTLIIHGAADPGVVYSDITRLLADAGDVRPAREETLVGRWPPTGLMLEARARRGRWPLALVALRVLIESAFTYKVVTRGKKFGPFDAGLYLEEVATNTDFCKHDATLSFVVDCPEEQIAAIGKYLTDRAARGELRYGMHVSATALMTCLVGSAVGHDHVHFVDGGDGGYTIAAKGLKLAAA